MTTYLSIFGGNAVRPADTSFSDLTLSEDTTLSWPSDGGTIATSAIMEIYPSVSGKKVILPDARRVGNGETITFKNTGPNSFTVADSAGGSVVTIAPGNVYTVYLYDNASASGGWSYWQAGAGSSTVDAAAIDGPGLAASGGLLQVNSQTNYYSVSRSLVDADRGDMIEWTGGSGTFTMPAAATVGNGWYVFIKNSGSGTLTLAPAGSELFDGEASISVSPTEGAVVWSDGVNYTFLRSASANTANAITRVAIDVAGTGDYTLSSAEYEKKMLYLTGALTGNRNIIVPNSVREYWVDNNTTGNYSVTVKTASGSGVIVTQGETGIVFCNGSNGVFEATNSLAGTREIVTYGGNANLYLTSIGGSGNRWLVYSGTGGGLAIYDATAGRSVMEFFTDGTIVSYGFNLFGYSGGVSVTQATSKATSVTANKATGLITTASDALAANTTVSFNVSNSLVGSASDTVTVHRTSGGTAGAYNIWVDAVTAGQFTVCVRNTTGGSLSEAINIKFQVWNGSNS